MLRTCSQSQKATTVKSPTGYFVCYLSYYCDDNLASSTYSRTHSQSQKATTVNSPIGQFVCEQRYDIQVCQVSTNIIVSCFDMGVSFPPSNKAICSFFSTFPLFVGF